MKLKVHVRKSLSLRRHRHNKSVKDVKNHTLVSVSSISSSSSDDSLDKNTAAEKKLVRLLSSDLPDEQLNPVGFVVEEIKVDEVKVKVDEVKVDEEEYSTNDIYRSCPESYKSYPDTPHEKLLIVAPPSYDDSVRSTRCQPYDACRGRPREMAPVPVDPCSAVVPRVALTDPVAPDRTVDCLPVPSFKYKSELNDFIKSHPQPPPPKSLQRVVEISNTCISNPLVVDRIFHEFSNQDCLKRYVVYFSIVQFLCVAALVALIACHYTVNPTN